MEHRTHLCQLKVRMATYRQCRGAHAAVTPTHTAARNDAAVLPKKSTSSSPGYGLSSAVDAVVAANEKVSVPSDFAVAIPEGTYGRIAPRSGPAAKYHLAVVAGVLFSHVNLDFHVSNGDRIAQLLFERIAFPQVVAVDSLPETLRGAQVFGYLGLNAQSEYADISSAAAGDISVESVNILDNFQGTFCHNLIAISPIGSVPISTAVAEHWEVPTITEAATSAVPTVPPEVFIGSSRANHIHWK